MKQEIASLTCMAIAFYLQQQMAGARYATRDDQAWAFASVVFVIIAFMLMIMGFLK